MTRRDALTERDSLIAGLRACADFLEAHPAVPVPCAPLTLNSWTESREELATVAKAATWEKYHQDLYFILRRRFGNGAVQFDVNLNRQRVCRPVVVGTRRVAAVAEHDVDIVMWECDESIFETAHDI